MATINGDIRAIITKEIPSNMKKQPTPSFSANVLFFIVTTALISDP